MRSHGFLLAVGLALASFGAQSAVISDPSSIPMPVFQDFSHHSPEQMAAMPDGGLNYFGFSRGPLAPYNTFLVVRAGKRAGNLSVVDLASMRIGSAQASWASSRYENFYFSSDDQDDALLLASNNHAFESDNRAYARLIVPEPATLALLALGLVGLWVSRHQVHTH